jgi:hypothetical protein
MIHQWREWTLTSPTRLETRQIHVPFCRISQLMDSDDRQGIE